jgi:hypothetical protein
VAFDPFSSQHDRFFPVEMQHWQHQDQPLTDGLRKAEALRLQLLAVDGDITALQRILTAAAELQLAASEALQTRRPITQFNLKPEYVEAQLSGKQSLSAASFEAFDGRWFGRWGDSEVHHDWQPTEVLKEPRIVAENLPAINALQYAWISNGFGWNYLVSRTEEKTADRPYVLGMVYYFDGQDFITIRGGKAHVGVSDGPTRLIWLTAHEVFLEEVYPAEDPSLTTYAITAMYHDLLSDKPTVSRRATQAVYTRDPENRPDFFEFNW